MSASMRTTKIALAAVLWILFASPLVAQTVTRTLNWNQPNATLAEVQALVYTSQVDSLTPVILKPSCLAGTPVTCTAPIVFTSGPHTITLTATNAFGSASVSLTGAPPNSPVAISITISVTVP